MTNMIAKARLFLTADSKALVAEGDPKGATLYCAPGDEIPESAAKMFGLVDGDLPKKAGKGDKGDKGDKGTKEDGGGSDKEKKAGENKGGAGTADATKGAGAAAGDGGAEAGAKGQGAN